MSQKLDTADLCGPRTDRGHNMNTASGIPFWPLDPRPDDIRLADIAAHLARICRFNGALRQEVEHYSVAQHCVLVSLNVPQEFALAGLLHDAAEAYTGDMIKPLKHAVPAFKEIAARIDAAICERFRLATLELPCIKEADYRAVLTERRDLLPENTTVDWGTPRAKPWPDRIVPWSAWRAQAEFINRFAELTRDRATFSVG